MKKVIFSLLFVALFVGCSTATPPNQWQYKSTTAFNSYQENFLKYNLIVAKADLQRSIKHAKMSADLTQLATIYLSKCALESAVSTQLVECREYEEIQPLIHDKLLESYYMFLQKKEVDSSTLPSEYKQLSQLFTSKSSAYSKTLFSIKKPTSFFIGASLLQDSLSLEEIDRVIKKASLYGYKHLVLFWLKKALVKTNNLQKRENLRKKLEILTK